MTAPSRWSSRPWQWALTALLVAGVPCAVAWPRGTVRAAGALIGVTAVVVGVRMLNAERRAAQAADGPWIRAYREDLIDAQDAILRVRRLHRKANNGETCVYCAGMQRLGYDTSWPCDTVRALTPTTDTPKEPTT